MTGWVAFGENLSVGKVHILDDWVAWGSLVSKMTMIRTGQRGYSGAKGFLLGGEHESG
jgi:hypothetical protein